MLGGTFLAQPLGRVTTGKGTHLGSPQQAVRASLDVQDLVVAVVRAVFVTRVRDAIGRHHPAQADVAPRDTLATLEHDRRERHGSLFTQFARVARIAALKLVKGASKVVLHVGEGLFSELVLCFVAELGREVVVFMLASSQY